MRFARLAGRCYNRGATLRARASLAPDGGAHLTNRSLRNLIVGAVILAVAFPFALHLWRRPQRHAVNYTAFIELVQAGKVSHVEIGDGKVDGRLNTGQQFTTFVPPGDTSYIELLKTKGVIIEVAPRSRSRLWASMLSTLLPVLLLVGLWMLMLRQQLDSGRAARSRDQARLLILRMAKEDRISPEDARALLDALD